MQQAPAEASEVTACPRAVVVGSVPVGHHLTLHRDLTSERLHPPLDPPAVLGTGRHRPRSPIGGRPLDIADRRSVAGIKEARGPAFRWLPAVEPRLGAGHGVATLFQSGGNGRQLLGAPGLVDVRGRAFVALERRDVVALRLGIGVRHLHVEVEGPEIVTERHQILHRDLPDLFQLLFLALGLDPALPAPPHRREDRKDQETDQEDGEQTEPRLALRVTRAFLSDLLESGDEVREHSGGVSPLVLAYHLICERRDNARCVGGAWAGAGKKVPAR